MCQRAGQEEPCQIVRTFIPWMQKRLPFCLQHLQLLHQRRYTHIRDADRGRCRTRRRRRNWKMEKRHSNREFGVVTPEKGNSPALSSAVSKAPVVDHDQAAEGALEGGHDQSALPMGN
ncbi:hypothetical protein PIB30_083191 [Stylosanthes scabra]|uniref:Uncharacterized protein n=1 Tax=Stylosanthes scabra TaxID=79078 RepID=A0ABU6WT51_9FABA|nr:hypothetical protein [Stylosanthes scabra]